MSGPVETARDSWGEDLPGWVGDLAAECAAASQNQVARQLGVSAAMISQVIRAKYPGDLARVRDLFQGAYRAATIECPALGTLPVHECRGWQAKARRFESSNTLRIRMYRACHRCARFGKEAANGTA